MCWLSVCLPKWYAILLFYIITPFLFFYFILNYNHVIGKPLYSCMYPILQIPHIVLSLCKHGLKTFYGFLDCYWDSHQRGLHSISDVRPDISLKIFSLIYMQIILCLNVNNRQKPSCSCRLRVHQLEMQKQKGKVSFKKTTLFPRNHLHIFSK